MGEVVISHPEISQLYLSVCYKTKDGKGKTKQLGAAALPVAALREGVRCVSLVDEHGAPLLLCKLLTTHYLLLTTYYLLLTTYYSPRSLTRRAAALLQAPGAHELRHSGHQAGQGTCYDLL